MVFSYFVLYDLDSLGPRTHTPILLVLQPSHHPGMWLPFLTPYPSPGLSHSSQGGPRGSGSEQSCLLPSRQEEQCFQSGRIDTWNCPHGWQGANILEEHCFYVLPTFEIQFLLANHHVPYWGLWRVFIFICLCALLFWWFKQQASGKLGPPRGALNKRLDSSNMLPLLFVPHLHTHSLSNRLNEMGSGALCERKRMKIMATQAK